MATYELHPQAAREMRAVYSWYESQRPGLGAEFLTSLRSALEALTLTPLAGPPWPNERAQALGVRRILLPRFRYALPYLILGNERIVVLAVAHFRRRPTYWLNRAETYRTH
jgi:toxin ParE1/3/4